MESEQGKKANYPRFYRQALEQLAKEQRILSRKRKGSARREKQRVKVAKLQEKTATSGRTFFTTNQEN
ncbi:transposase [Gracilibacillus alcaliphilus]|nr:transposase [Gracilibacillus alcaliphilus]